MKKLGSSLLIVLALAGIGSAQVSTTPAAIQLNTIYAGADGKFEAAPDTAVIHMDVASQQDTSRAAYDHAAAAVDQRCRGLRSYETANLRTRGGLSYAGTFGYAFHREVRKTSRAAEYLPGCIKDRAASVKTARPSRAVFGLFHHFFHNHSPVG